MTAPGQALVASRLGRAGAAGRAAARAGLARPRQPRRRPRAGRALRPRRRARHAARPAARHAALGALGAGRRSAGRGRGGAGPVRGGVRARSGGRGARGPELRLARLATLFGLTRFDLDVVLACLAPELDRRYERLYGYLHDDVTRRRPSVDLVLALFLPDVAVRVAARARFDPDAPLLRFRLVELGDEPEQPSATLLGRTLRLDPRIAAHLLGDDAPDVRLRASVIPVTTGAPGSRRCPPRRGSSWNASRSTPATGRSPCTAAATTTPSGGLRSPRSAERCTAACSSSTGHGGRRRPRRGRRRRRACRPRRPAAPRPALLGRRRRPARGGPPRGPGRPPRGPGRPRRRDPRGRDGDVGTGRRRARDALPPGGAAGTRGGRAGAAVAGGAGSGDRAGAGSTGTRSSGSRSPGARSPGTRRHVPAERRADRRRRRDGLQPRARPRPAAPDPVGRRPASRGAAALEPAPRPAGPRGHPARGLGRPRPARGPAAQLREMPRQVRHRGDGATSDWGFGDELARARASARCSPGRPAPARRWRPRCSPRELGLDSTGSTCRAWSASTSARRRRTCARIFDEAETRDAILFFDEADALFGKRSEVGTPTTATPTSRSATCCSGWRSTTGWRSWPPTCASNIDEAFLRRLRFVVDFPFPDAGAARLRIWRSVCPGRSAARPDVDLDLPGPRSSSWPAATSATSPSPPPSWPRPTAAW